MAEITGASASTIRMDYMKLLITQLQHQNPLEPVSNDQMTMQLAQMSQLEQLENVNQNFDQVLNNLNRDQAHKLIGKEVAFSHDNEDGTTDAASGVVSQVQLSANDVQLLIGNRTVGLQDILSIRNP